MYDSASSRQRTPPVKAESSHGPDPLPTSRGTSALHAILAVLRSSSHFLLLAPILLPALGLFLTGIQACEEDADGDGWTESDGDCDDGDANTYPGAEELCDGIDNDCDGTLDDGLPSSTWYADSDGDGYGDSSSTISSCAQPDAYVRDNTDCDDDSAASYPGAEEICDNEDNDCDGERDEGLPKSTWYQDADNDGFGLEDAVALECAQPADYAAVAGDCDDQSSLVYPGAREICDGLDGDCDGEADPPNRSPYYPDADGDGFGDTAAVSCESLPGYVQARGDCDDADSSSYPGADDPPNDGIDRDCGGDDAPQPSVGFASSQYNSIQEALDAAVDGETVWIAAGTYLEHDIDFQGKAVTSSGTHGPHSTIIDAGNNGRIFIFESGETQATRVVGLTLTGGLADGGGAVYIEGASPIFEEVRFVQNVSRSAAGAVYANATSSEFINCEFSDNESEENTVAGALEARDSHLNLFNCAFAENFSPYCAGAMIAMDSDLRMEYCELRDNLATYYAGGIWLSSSQLELSHSLMTGHTGTLGGAILADAGSTLEIASSTFTQNTATTGGAIEVENSSATITNVFFLDNASNFSNGGAVYAYNSSLQVTNSTFVGNIAPSKGGGLYASGDSAHSTLTNSIFAYNVGYNLYLVGETEVRYNLLYSPRGLNHNLSSIERSNVLAEPRFIDFTPDNDFEADDYHLAADSPASDAGEPSLADPDGSSSDIGVYGGPEADFDYYTDSDEDGMYDGWETARGLDPTREDGSADPDGDGLTNLEEFAALSSPRQADTDGDGIEDGVEEGSGSDALDWYARPGGSNATAHVPADFATLQAALDAIRSEGDIELTPGIYTANNLFRLKSAKIYGTTDTVSTVLEGDGGSVLIGAQVGLELSALTLTGGSDPRGSGGLHAWYSDVTLSDLVVSENSGMAGGVYLLYSSGSISDSLFTGNVAQRGGGMELAVSDISISHCTFTDNRATSVGGGGLSLINSSPELRHCLFESNRSDSRGGGFYIDSGEPSITNCRFISNTSSGNGGGLYLNTSDAEISHCTFINNSSRENGGGISLYQADPLIRNCTLVSNSASNYGGGLEGFNASPLLINVNVVVNEASSGAGLAFGSDLSEPELRNCILAYNSPYNFYIRYGYNIDATVQYSDLYSASGTENHNLESLDETNLTVEPGFLEYLFGLPTAYHLAVSSRLIDMGAPELSDVDGSSSDLGAFGGPLGEGWDLDDDAYPNYFWPGELEDAPDGFSPSDYDANDTDAEVH